MNCTYEEAKARYPVGTKFKVVPNGTPYSYHPTEKRTVQPGDILDLVEITRSGHAWNLIYKIDINIHGFPKDSIHCSYITPQLSDEPKVCQCDLNRGCDCGIFESEMKKIYGEAWTKPGWNDLIK